jgi:hypothetical protein
MVRFREQKQNITDILEGVMGLETLTTSYILVLHVDLGAQRKIP